MQRAFIVGNGNSLNETKLELLQKDVSFACNSIGYIYDKTTWRPTHYIRAEDPDVGAVELYKEDMDTHINLGCSVYCSPYFTKPYENVHYIDACHHFKKNFDDITAPIQWHLPTICTFGSSVHVAIQIAVNLGLGPLYLIGCDLDYEDGKDNHFDPRYKDGSRNARYNNMNNIHAYINAIKCSPVPIYNATIGGKLEVYERVDFKSLFS